MKNTRWSVINSTPYIRCALQGWLWLLSGVNCDPDPDMGDRLKIIESAVLTLTSGQQGKQKSDPPAAKQSGEFCRKWNLGGCSYPHCRHSHSCSKFRGNDPAVKCPICRFSSPAGQRSFPLSTGVKNHPY